MVPLKNELKIIYLKKSHPGRFYYEDVITEVPHFDISTCIQVLTGQGVPQFDIYSIQGAK